MFGVLWFFYLVVLGFPNINDIALTSVRKHINYFFDILNFVSKFSYLNFLLIVVSVPMIVFILNSLCTRLIGSESPLIKRIKKFIVWSFSVCFAFRKHVLIKRIYIII